MPNNKTTTAALSAKEQKINFLYNEMDAELLVKEKELDAVYQALQMLDRERIIYDFHAIYATSRILMNLEGVQDAK